MSRRRDLLDAPLAVANDGSLLVNVAHLDAEPSLAGLMACAKASGLPVFVGVVVPPRLVGCFVHDADDLLADVVGRLGARLMTSMRGRADSTRRSRKR